MHADCCTYLINVDWCNIRIFFHGFQQSVPEGHRFIIVITVTHHNFIIIGIDVVFRKMLFNLHEQFVNGFLSAPCHAAWENLAVLHDNHRLNAEHIDRTAKHLADSSAVNQIIQTAYRKDNSAGWFNPFQCLHTFFQRKSCRFHPRSFPDKNSFLNRI